MPRLNAYKPSRIAFMNLTYRTACFYKIALISALLFVATWFILFSQLSFGFPVDADGDFLPLGTGNTLSGGDGSLNPDYGRIESNNKNKARTFSPAQNSLASGVRAERRGGDSTASKPPVTFHRQAILPSQNLLLAATSMSIPKLSVGEAYASLIATATTSIEPAILPGNLGIR